MAMDKNNLPIGVSVGGNEGSDEPSVYIDIGQDAEGYWAIGADAARQLAIELNRAADLVDSMKKKH
jgi:hypothetical protein